ncbi:protein Red-like [Clavelina lepadiformis]|uniref:protein Red-like n=1 Tax=Clavelina lepadiformis TaxID=159417 RepID=UPI00404282D3
MKTMAAELYSNPLPPEIEDESSTLVNEPLTNADFRKLLSTPRQLDAKPNEKTQRGFAVPREYTSTNDSAAEQRRKKKSFYAKLKKQEMERQAELAKKYRDRSKERREGKGDYTDVELISTTADYRAVGPTSEMDRTSAEKRRQVIQESKFLGGDMAHTHLVKGLDFALLQKVRAEISTKERENEEILDDILEKDQKSEPTQCDNVVDSMNNKMAKNVYRILFQQKIPIRNETFLPGRMAYVFELEDEYADSDLPTTLMRSKMDCPTLETHTTLSTNDIVINKLTQILAYLRHGSKDKHKKKKEKKSKSEIHKPAEADMNIFDDVGEYVPPSKASKKHSKHGVGPYFEKSELKKEDERLALLNVSANASVKQLVQNIHEQQSTKEKVLKTEAEAKVKKSAGNPLLGGNVNAPDSYAECYPSTQFNISGMGEDSDEEADYSKMDIGNKKGPVGRWDFDTQEEYSSYMSKREAMPKAAFQYGIKMSGGRKTRRTREQNEKQKLNRELQQIQQIITKRKGSSKNDGDNYKKPKY